MKYAAVLFLGLSIGFIVRAHIDTLNAYSDCRGRFSEATCRFVLGL
jgi:hypothetical protein